MNARRLQHRFLAAALALVVAAGGIRSLSAQEKKPEDPKPAPKPEAAEKPAKQDQPAAAIEATEGFEEIELFTRVLEMVRQNYVDPDKTTYDKLINSALMGMLEDLDPHSQFMQPQVFEQLRRNTGSTYEGVGITIAIRSETLTIVTVREDGPAARAGVLAGDQILKINNILTKDVGLSEAVNLLKGKPGETLELTLRRPATKELIDVEMVREVIQQSTLHDISLLDEKLTVPYKIGYARILQFGEPTAEELADALDELEQQGMQAFILDLRNNPGGLLTSAVNVCGEFVKPGTTVLTTEGRPGSGEIKPYITRAKKNGRNSRDYPVAILVNHASASGSEVVAGALQDLKRAIIVGVTTFGKGSVQTIVPVSRSGGKAVRMTTAKYYTPSHRTIHENGVVPNIVAAMTPDEEQKLARWFRRNSLSEADQKKLDNSFTDIQLVRAVDAMKGALVYSRPKENGKEKQVVEVDSPAEEAKPEEKKPEEEEKKKPETDPEKPDDSKKESEEKKKEGE